MCENVVSGMNRLLSKSPLAPLTGLPLVTVWAALSSLVHVTVPPRDIIAFTGIKQPLVVSQPGTAVPVGILIDTLSAKDTDVINPMRVIKNIKVTGKKK